MSTTLPVLESARLLLTGARHEDLPVLQAHWNEPRVRRYLFDDRPVDEPTAASVLSACLAGVPSGHGLWLVSEKQSQQFVGSVALVPTSVAAQFEPALAGLLEPMVSLQPERWGHGFAAEGLCAVLRHAFSNLARPSVAAVNDVPNVASERMLLRAGFSVLSEVDGPRYRLRTYTLDRERWFQRVDA